MPVASRLPVFVAALLLGACGSIAPATPSTPQAATGIRPATPAPAAASDAPSVLRVLTLRPGEQADLAGGSLRYLRLVNDSRCQPDVQCIWAGDAEIAFAWTPAAGNPRNFSLHTGTGPRTQPLGQGQTLRLAALERGAAPAARLEVLAEPGR